jgi:Phage-integrase repeat unit
MSQNGVSIDLEKNLTTYHPLLTKYTKRDGKDWLGTGRLATKDLEFLPFEEARQIARSLKFKSNEEYKEYCRSKNRHLPMVPNIVYEKKWKGWGDFLATGNITRINRKFWPFPKAKKFVQSLGLKDGLEYRQWCRSGQKPDYIPSAPHKVYKKQNQWNGWEDFLGTGFLTFEEAKKFVHSLGLKSEDEWREYYRSGQKPDNIPTSPNNVYKKEWKGMGDWLGTGTVAARLKEFRSVIFFVVLVAVFVVVDDYVA